MRLGGGVAVVVVGLLAGTVPASADPTSAPSKRPGATAETTPGETAHDETTPDGSRQDLDLHADPAILAASAALVAAEADLATARQALATVRAELVAARKVDAQARIDLRAAELAEERAERAQSSVLSNIAGHRTNLGRLANRAYRANGPLGEWSLVLASQTPEQLVDRLAFVQSVANAGNSMIADLREDRADLTTLRARLAAARMLQERVRAAAAAAVARTAEKEKQATLAEQQLAALVTVHRAAVEAALAAKAEDRARVQLLTAHSGALAERIRTMAATLALLERPPKGTGRFVLPGTGGITSPYGPRLHPILNYVKVHTGLDLGSGDGIVYAADRGVVLITEANTAYGNMIVVDHGLVGGLRITTLYAHQAAFGVKPGDRVRRGQPIGVIGATGFATGPHLHFEVRVDGAPLGPGSFLDQAPLPAAARP